MNKYRPYHCNNIFMTNIIIIIIIKIIIICTIITNLQFTNAQQQTNNKTVEYMTILLNNDTSISCIDESFAKNGVSIFNKSAPNKTKNN